MILPMLLDANAARRLLIIPKLSLFWPLSRGPKGVNPFRTALPFLGTNILELDSECPQIGSAVLKGLIKLHQA